ncbi:hypothetical protein LCGC14_2605020 [marine sediment metagenome]|uniref:Uncharacterized protein n=1 Tax=marine sediment metagenome TaxID=412755 RepID=A0A0F9A7W2_9ZZZZ
MTDEETLAQEYVDHSSVRVRDPKLVRKYIKPGERTSRKTYNRLVRLIAETGALVIPFRELPEVRKLIKQ